MPDCNKNQVHLWLVPLLVFAAVYASSEYVVHLDSERQHGILRNQVLANESTLRAQLEGEVNSTIYLASGLGGYVSAYRSPDEKDVNVVLATVFRQDRHLRNIALAPDNTIKFIYPLQGNEKAVGLHYESIPRQWPAVKRAIETRSTVVAGPVDLVQGGHGLISRTPVFLPDGRYWGIVSLVMNTDSLFTMLDQTAGQAGIVWALRGTDGQGERGGMIHGDARLFRSLSNIRQTIRIPGGSWEMAAAPLAGWDHDNRRTWILRLSGIGLSLLIAILTYVAFSERIHIRHLATHDPLTNLPNRRLLSDRLELAIAQSRRDGQGFSILCIDLDNFKPINDQYGHHVGDEVLRAVASCLQKCLRSIDTVARVGGDEFMVILPDAQREIDAREVANRVAEAIKEPIRVGEILLQVGASIGICHYPGDARTQDELMRITDEAMYRAKKNARGTIYAMNGQTPI